MPRVFAFASCLLALAGCERDASSPPQAAAPVPGQNCQRAEQREFDFWAGRWEVHTADGTLAGHNHIEVAHGGCALLEQWKSARGGSGTSTNYWDPVTRKWTQNWVDAAGSVIQLEGGLRGESMILEGRYAKPDGEELQMRGTWTPLEDGRVRQYFETRAPDAEWTPWFEGFYTRQS